MFRSERRTDGPITPLDDSQVELRNPFVDVRNAPIHEILLNPFGRSVHSRVDLTTPSVSNRLKGNPDVLTSIAKRR